nr:SdrD B-like domain-containing protein [Haliscomenobacter sp.]
MLDRKGHQYAINNHDYAGNLQDYEYSTAGELLRANVSFGNNGCTYSIVARSGTADYYADNLIHDESVQGPLAVLPGGGDAIAVWLDPIKIRSGGTIRLNNITGDRVPNSAYEVTDDRFTTDADFNNEATPSKANALGDVELSGDVSDLEIGNVVWADKDGDGVQDGDERCIAGVEIELLRRNIDDTYTLIATDVTNATGNYAFNDDNVPGGLLPQANYIVRISSTQYSGIGVNNTPLQRMLLTTTDAVGEGFADYSDNDAETITNPGIAQIAVTTKDYGENNHTYDFGFIPVDYGDLPEPLYHTTVANNGPSPPRFGIETGSQCGLR